jgi:hypothetical protein
MNIVTSSAVAPFDGSKNPPRSVVTYFAFTEPELNTVMASHESSGHVTAFALAISAHHVTARAKQTSRDERRE